MTISGFVDGMEGAYVCGWAVAESGVPCRVTVTDGAGTVLGEGVADRHRPDLAALGLPHGNFGFRVATTLPARPGRIFVRAEGTELHNSPLKIGPAIFDAVAGLAGGGITGWISQRTPDATLPPLRVTDQRGRDVARGVALPDARDPRAPARLKLTLDDACFGAGLLTLTVHAGATPVAVLEADLTLRGTLENVAPDNCAGWLVAPQDPARSFELDVYRDGVFAGRGRTTKPRADVAKLFPGCATPAFSITLREPDADARESCTLSVRLAGAAQDLFEGPYLVTDRQTAMAAAQQVAQLAHDPALSVAMRAVLRQAASQFMAEQRFSPKFASPHQPGAAGTHLAIIIPVYKDAALTAACITSVLAARAAGDEIVLVNDASPEPEMAPLLANFARMAADVTVLTNPGNLGFVKSVNRAISFCTGADLLLLNSDTEIFPGGLAELKRVAAADDSIATVTALSNNATIFSYPGQALAGAELADITWAELARAALALNEAVTVEVPTGHGFCLLIKAGVMREIGQFSETFGPGYCEENEFCMRASALGYRHVAAAGVLVLHHESTSFGAAREALIAQNMLLLTARYPEYPGLIDAYLAQDSLRLARRPLDRLRLARAAARGTGFTLTVTNALAGGTARAITDIAAAGPTDAVALTLRAATDGMMEVEAAAMSLLARFAPGEEAALFELLEVANPRSIAIHQLLGFGAAFCERLSGWAADRDAVFYLHDYYPLCPRVTLIDAANHFCDIAATDVCTRCVAAGGAHEAARLALAPAAHRALFAGLLRGMRRIIAPSASAAAYLRRGMPGLTVEVEPHPEAPGAVPPAPREGNDTDILLLGALGPHKGSATLLEIARLACLTHPALHFRVVGYTDIDDALEAVGNVTITGAYTAESLPALLAAAPGRLALFLSPWPETYGYTLSEAVRYGFIPVVPALGAPAERVRAAGFGVVYRQASSAADILGVLADIAAGRVPKFSKGATPAAIFEQAA
jgi:GT2 family glycosyltransferase/glycosyltransferase involved in cell wall biosynthesis